MLQEGPDYNLPRTEGSVPSRLERALTQHKWHQRFKGSPTGHQKSRRLVSCTRLTPGHARSPATLASSPRARGGAAGGGAMPRGGAGGGCSRAGGRSRGGARDGHVCTQAPRGVRAVSPAASSEPGAAHPAATAPPVAQRAGEWAPNGESGWAGHTQVSARAGSEPTAAAAPSGRVLRSDSRVPRPRPGAVPSGWGHCPLCGVLPFGVGAAAPLRGTVPLWDGGAVPCAGHCPLGG